MGKFCMDSHSSGNMERDKQTEETQRHQVQLLPSLPQVPPGRQESPPLMLSA